MRFLFVFLLLLTTPVSIAQESERAIIEAGVEAMMQNDYEKSLSLLIKAKSLAEQNKNHEDLFLALNNIGANYYAMLDYGEALSNYLLAYTIAIDYLEPVNEMSVLNNIAILYSKEKNYDEAEEYFKKAYDIADKNNELNKLGLYSINLGAVLNEKGNLNEAERYINKALKIFDKDSSMTLDANLILTNNYLLKGKYHEAIQLSIQLEPQLIGIEYEEHRIANYLIISEAYQNLGNFPKAYEYANKGLSEDINLEGKISVYRRLTSLYIAQDRLREALNTKDLLFDVESELNTIKNGRLYESNKVKFEVENYQRELLYQEEKIKNKEKQFYILLSGAVLLIVFFVWALRNSWLKSKQKKKLHEKAEELMLMELEKEKTLKLLLEKELKEKEANALFQQEKLKNEIEAKNRQLSAKALYLSSRNSLVSGIISDLDRIYHVRRDPELKSQMQNLKGLLKTDDEWDSFVRHFDEVNHGFIDKLKREYSLLNSNDIRYLTYIYMNLSVKEISSILNITPEACRKRKERVSNKLKLKPNSNLHDFLYTFN